MSSAPAFFQFTRRTSSSTATTTSSGSPTARTSVAYPISRPTIAQVSQDGWSDQHSAAMAMVMRKTNSTSDMIMCSSCSSNTSNSTGNAGSVAPHHGSPRRRSTA